MLLTLSARFDCTCKLFVHSWPPDVPFCEPFDSRYSQVLFMKDGSDPLPSSCWHHDCCPTGHTYPQLLVPKLATDTAASQDHRTGPSHQGISTNAGQHRVCVSPLLYLGGSNGCTVYCIELQGNIPCYGDFSDAQLMVREGQSTEAVGIGMVHSRFVLNLVSISAVHQCSSLNAG